MALMTKTAWLLLALIHVAPAVVFIAPTMVQRLYGVDPAGDIGVLLIHRGALFLAVLVAALVAMVDVRSERLASIVVGVSMIGFLIVYARAGFPVGPLRKIAITDITGLLPLTLVIVSAWR
ncbi:MAG: hypothetical protein AAFX52_07905 [Pseudomonadota bacterium]